MNILMYKLTFANRPVRPGRQPPRLVGKFSLVLLFVAGVNAVLVLLIVGAAHAV